MITLRELLADKTYKEFLLTKPELPQLIIPRPSEPWRVYIQREMDGNWAFRDFRSYVEAFKLLKKHLPYAYDAAIHSRGVAFKPPHRTVRVTRGGMPVMVKTSSGKTRPMTKVVYWKPKLPAEEGAHLWCPYCRRPVEIRWFSKHHAFGKDKAFDKGLQRCVICGASELLMRGVR